MKQIIIAILIMGLMNGCVFKRAVKGVKGHGGGHGNASMRR
ncbi:hypothetical protein [Sulfurovum sp. bin170]|nr:hypothetical protein [Sulfurovum sp. bin170]